MKRMLIFIVVILSVFILTSCESSEEELNVDVKLVEFKSLLITGGYTLEMKTYGRVFDYHRINIKEPFELDLDIYQLYVGYINETEREAFLVAFETSEDAILYENAMANQDGYAERLVYRENQVVLVTESQETIDLFK